MKRVLVCSVLLLCAGCGPAFHVKVDSICSGKLLAGSKCVVRPADPNTTGGSLQFREYASYIERALQEKGYKLTDNINEAQVIVFLAYGISEPHESHYSYSTPVWGQTGVSSAYTTGSVYNYGGGTSSYSGTTTYTPQYGITGYQSHSGTRISYTRHVVLDAYDLKEYQKTQKEVQLWRTTITSSGSSGDLRQVFPVMVAASLKHIGKNTGKQVKVVLWENDKRVQEIKGLAKKQCTE